MNDDTTKTNKNIIPSVSMDSENDTKTAAAELGFFLFVLYNFKVLANLYK